MVDLDKLATLALAARTAIGLSEAFGPGGRHTVQVTGHDLAALVAVAATARALVRAQKDWFASWGDNDRRIPAAAARREAEAAFVTAVRALELPSAAEVSEGVR